MGLKGIDELVHSTCALSLGFNDRRIPAILGRLTKMEHGRELLRYAVRPFEIRLVDDEDIADFKNTRLNRLDICLLYTSDAADE